MSPVKPDPIDLEAIFRDCGSDLVAYFRRRHRGTEAAADLVQESFLQLARRLRKGEAPSSPRAYLFGIARHLSLAFLRQQAGNRSHPLECAVNLPVVTEPDGRVAAAREVIASLPDLQREILDLRFAHGLSYAEIALVLEIPVGTVRSRLHHAIAMLREKLETGDNF